MDIEKLISWLEGERFIYFDGCNWIYYGEELTTSEEFEEKFKWEISRNRMITKTIKYIKEEIQKP